MRTLVDVTSSLIIGVSFNFHHSSWCVLTSSHLICIDFLRWSITLTTFLCAYFPFIALFVKRSVQVFCSLFNRLSPLCVCVCMFMYMWLCACVLTQGFALSYIPNPSSLFFSKFLIWAQDIDNQMWFISLSLNCRYYLSEYKLVVTTFLFFYFLRQVLIG